MLGSYPGEKIICPHWWKMLAESCKGRLPPMYRAFLDMCTGVLAGDLLKVVNSIHNVFDPIVTEEHLELNYIKSLMNSYDGVGMQMTGSGSAVFAIVSQFEAAAVICNMLKENFPNVFIAKPV